MKKILVCSWLAKNVFFGKPSGGSEKRAYLLFSELPYNKEVSFFIKGTKMDECRLNYQKNNYKLYTTNSWWIIIDFIKNVRKNNIFASFDMEKEILHNNTHK